VDGREADMEEDDVDRGVVLSGSVVEELVPDMLLRDELEPLGDELALLRGGLALLGDEPALLIGELALLGGELAVGVELAPPGDELAPLGDELVPLELGVGADDVETDDDVALDSFAVDSFADWPGKVGCVESRTDEAVHHCPRNSPSCPRNSHLVLTIEYKYHQTFQDKVRHRPFPSLTSFSQ
jgi:hypothetical protein